MGINWIEAEFIDKELYLANNRDTELSFFSFRDGVVCYKCNDFSVSGIPADMLEAIETLDYLLSSLIDIEIKPE